MAGGLTVLPPKRTGLDELVEAFLAQYNPRQAMAMEYMLKKKMADQERNLPMSPAEAEKMQKQFEYDKQLKLIQPPFPKIPSSIMGGTRQRGYGTQLTGISGEGKPTYSVDNPQEIFGRTTKLRTEFIDRPEVKDYVSIKTQVGAMDNLLQYSTNGAPNVNNPLDQALIMTYNKILDPTSVVRESEYARTPENLSTVNRIQGAIEKFSEGGAGLTADDRQALVLGAKIIADERGKRFNEALKGYQKVSTSAAVVPQDVIRGFRPHKQFNKEAKKKEEKSNLKVGEQFMGKKILSIEPYRGD